MAMDFTQVDIALAGLTLKDLSESLRLLHGRGKCFPGFEQLCIDWFDPVILITRFKEVDGFDLHKLSDHLIGLFQNNFPTKHVQAIVFQDRSRVNSCAEVCYGDLPETCLAIEGSLKYHIDLMNFKNIGYFLDAKNVRAKVIEICKGKRVLNLFAFTCAFSVAALANGAKSVVNLDMGKGVLDRGRENHLLNGLDNNNRNVSYIKSDIFKAWKKLQNYGPYDIIIIDPPTLQKGSFRADKDYIRVVNKLGDLLEDEATIFACLNSPFLGEPFLDSLFLEGALNQNEHTLKKVMRVSNPKAFQDSDPLAGLKVMQYAYRQR